MNDALLKDVTVTRSEEINKIPGNCPWIGIYRSRVTYPTRVLGYGPGMRDQRVNLIILVQEQDGSSGSNCEEALENLVQRVLSTLLSDTTLGGVVATIDGIEVQYPGYQKVADDAYMQTAAIYITAIGGVQ